MYLPATANPSISKDLETIQSGTQKSLDWRYVNDIDIVPPKLTVHGSGCLYSETLEKI